MTSVLPAIVLKMRHVYPKHQKGFGGYVDYIDREEAKNSKAKEHLENNMEFEDGIFHNYMDYMGDEQKNGSLFNEEENHITEEKLKEVRENFTKAEKMGSPMWDGIFSFDNEWLEEQGLYNSETNSLNEGVMKNIIRQAMRKMISEEKMRQPVWTASFHYNTDNIHVHTATVELDPSYLKEVQAKDEKTGKLLFDNETGDPIIQYRGKRKQETLNRMKSTVANLIVDRKKEYQRIDELIRGTAREIRTVNLSYLKETERLFQLALEHMPDDLRNWQYGKIVVNEARPYIDQIVENYIEEFHKEDYEELVSLLDEQVALNIRLYGEESNSDAYKENKLKDFKERMGSSVVTMLREYKKEEREANQNIFHVRLQKAMQKKGGKVQRELPPSFYSQRMNRNTMAMKHAAFQLNRVMRKSFQEHQKDRNLAEFDRMLEGYDYD